MKNITVGKIIEAKVTGVETYGIFINYDEYTGLIHISEISENFVKNVNDYAKVGDSIIAKIIEVDEEKKQLKLSIKEFDTNFKSKRERIKETSNGFNSLENNLEIWINDKLKEIQSK
mgnify:CR=1 FL=1